MAIREEEFAETVDLAYEAALSDRWQPLLEQLGRVFHSESPGVVPSLSIGRDGAPVVERFAIAERSFLDAWDTHYSQVLTDAVRPDRRGAGVYQIEEVAPVPLSRWEFYAEWLRPQGMRHMISDLTVRADGSMAAFGLHRAAQHGPFDSDEVADIERIAPHLFRSFALRERFRGMRAQHDAAQWALEQLEMGLVLVDERERFVVANDVVRRIAADDDGLSLSATGLRLREPASQRALRGLIRSAAATARGGTGGGGGALAVQRASGKRPYEIHVSPLPRDRLRVGSRSAAVAVFVSAPEPGPRTSEASLVELYGLTAAEARLAAAIGAGRSLELAADELGITRGTARNQLKQVFAKTRTHRQAALVRLFHTGVGRLESGVEESR